MRDKRLVGLVWLLSLLTAGCQTQVDEDGSEGRSNGDSNRSIANTESVSVQPSSPSGGIEVGSSANGAMGFAKTPDGSCRLQVSEEVCSAQAFESESMPLDIYVMFDRSGSMCSCVDPPMNGNPCPDPTCKKTRLQAIREALSAFMADRASAGIGMGIGYFGQQPIGAADCRTESYSAPDVAIAGLPQNTTNVTASLTAATPIGETPTGAAIRGACSYARQWKSMHPEREVVLLFVTDGEPKAPVSCPDGSGTCCPTLNDAVVAAADCLQGGAARIRTYVLGVGPFLQNLNQIAAAGGTSMAYLVDGGDVAQQVLLALNQIRGNASIPCDFSLPQLGSGEQIDLTKVNLAYANSSCEGAVFFQVKSAGACSEQGGWYYDDPAQPGKVLLCPSTCDAVSGPSGRLMFYVGCNTVTPIL